MQPFKVKKEKDKAFNKIMLIIGKIFIGIYPFSKIRKFKHVFLSKVLSDQIPISNIPFPSKKGGGGFIIHKTCGGGGVARKIN